MSPNPPRLQRVALVGNPNCGKTALFNRLTGSRQKVANYAGVTVERKSGLHQLQGANGALEIIDLPGAYTLEAASPDEAVTRDVCLGRFPGETAPDVIVCVLDAINLQLHLRFALEVLQLGRPMVLAVNRMDVAERHGLKIDLESLSSQLGVPVVGTVAVRRQGADALTAQLAKTPVPPTPRFTDPARWHEEAEALYDNAVSGDNQDTLTDAADRLLLHPATGLPLLAILMFVMFQAVFAWADPLIGGVESGIGMLGEVVAGAVPEGLLNSLLVAVCVTAGKTVLALLSALAFVYFRFPLKGLAFTLVLLSLMLPTEVLIIALFDLVSRDLKWADTYQAIIIPFLASATGTFLFRQHFMNIPASLADAARIDGCGPLRSPIPEGIVAAVEETLRSGREPEHPQDEAARDEEKDEPQAAVSLPTPPRTPSSPMMRSATSWRTSRPCTRRAISASSTASE